MTLELPDWPVFGLADDVRPAMRAAALAREPMALATLYAVGEGGPRPPGSQMLVTPTTASGFLSGGCIEADIALHAARVIDDGEPRHLVYGQGSPWPDIQLLCGSRLDILVERVMPGDPALTALLAQTDARHPSVWETDGRVRRLGADGGLAGPCEVRANPFQLRRRHTPVPRLVVFGSDPIALATASLGLQAGFETTLVRPKGPSEPPPFPGLSYSRGGPDKALGEIVPDAWTAIAVATHEWELDHEALLAALPSSASYVGGGRRAKAHSRAHGPVARGGGRRGVAGTPARTDRPGPRRQGALGNRHFCYSGDYRWPY